MYEGSLTLGAVTIKSICTIVVTILILSVAILLDKIKKNDELVEGWQN
ncbi:MAG: hypothetical protein WC536_04970 [Patescibacteria group bacterium]